MKLWLVRHAQPVVEPGVCYGALDVAANAPATAVAAVALSAELPAQCEVWVSPLRRCEQLARQLRALRPDLSFITDVRLAEMNFGVWEGVRWDDIPCSQMQRWTDDFGEYRFGGIECANDVLQRVACAWEDSYHLALQKGGHAVWLTHAGVARAAQLLSLGFAKVIDAKQWSEATPAFGQWSVIEPWQRLPG